MRTIDVNELGRDKEGNDFGHVASPDAIREGLCVNEPVRLRYPNGDIVASTELRMTPKGMAKLITQIKPAIGAVSGRA